MPVWSFRVVGSLLTFLFILLMLTVKIQQFSYKRPRFLLWDESFTLEHRSAQFETSLTGSGEEFVCRLI